MLIIKYQGILRLDGSMFRLLPVPSSALHGSADCSRTSDTQTQMSGLLTLTLTSRSDPDSVDTPTWPSLTPMRGQTLEYDF